MSDAQIIVEKDGAVGWVRINRPERLNAFAGTMRTDLLHALQELEADVEIRSVIITGVGRAFSTGGDISVMSEIIEEGDRTRFEQLVRSGADVVRQIDAMSKPVIAAINGFALGGGLELAMACHIRHASDRARMGLPEVSLGVIPGYGGTQRLTQLVGKGKSLEMIATAGMIDAEEALRTGLVTRVVPHDELRQACMETAGKIAKNSPLAIAAAIRSVNAYFAEGVDGMDVEIEAFGSCFGSADFVEGTTAFMEKRKPDFARNK